MSFPPSTEPDSLIDDTIVADTARSVTLPLTTFDTARYLTKRDDLTVYVRMNRDDYLDAMDSGTDALPLIHDLVYRFGSPREATAAVVGATGDDYVIRYTTTIATSIDPRG